jgi:hypothetical protein
MNKTSGVEAASPSEGDAGPSSEMRRQMEAAKERMKKYHAVYGQTADRLDKRPAEPASRTENR